VARRSRLAGRAGPWPARQSSDRPFNPGYGGRKVYFLKGLSSRRLTNGHKSGAQSFYQLARPFPNSRDGNLVLGRDKQAFFSARRLRAAPKRIQRRTHRGYNNAYDNEKPIIISALRALAYANFGFIIIPALQ